MEIHFLGGASGVGATCQLIRLGDRQILVDAGVRVDHTDRLPDLAALDGQPLDAILITHAHADHIGALPLIAARYPATPLYSSPTTIRLMEVMLGDAVRVMARRAADELEIPLYDDALVAATLRRLRPLQPGAQSLPELPGVAVHAQRAGHIAGAVSLGFEAADGRLVISGDVSVTPQRTILGAALPAPARPDLLVLESTYGARLHPNRTMEERRLAEAVAQVIEQGGHCLIPAFALGRSQEIILILRAAQRDGLIQPFPIAVDGLVRSVCAAYASFPEALTPALRRHILNGGKPFFGSTVQPIETPPQRERVLAGPPSAIISSSGMLTGGPAVWYAERLVEQRSAAIFFSGYLDEEAPGRRLLNLADAPPELRRLAFGERTLNVACQVGRYSLSAHADGDELAAIVRNLQPKSVALVHGDPESRAALAARLHGLTEVIIPQDGQRLQLEPSRRGGLRVAAPDQGLSKTGIAPISAGRAIDPAALESLWEALRDGTGVQVASVRELARAWSGEQLDDVAEQQMEQALAAPNPYFVPVPYAAGLWRLPTPIEVRRLQAAPGGSAGRSGPRPQMAMIQAVVERVFAHIPDLYQRSIDPETGGITLRYFFPAIAAARDAELIRQAGDETGVEVKVWPHPHQGQLSALALSLLPPELTAERSPAIYPEQGRVELRCAGQADEATVATAEAAFLSQTGLRLVVRTPQRAQSLPTSDEALFSPPEGESRSEVNYALNTARSWFDSATGFYKASADQSTGLITLRFHFPDTARQDHAEALAGLAAYTGWSVRLWPEPHQEALMAAARETLTATAVVMGAPALQRASREVIVRVQQAPDAALTPEAAEAFFERTGWRLRVKT